MNTKNSYSNTVSTLFREYLRSQSTSPVKVKSSRSKFATASQFSAWAAQTKRMNITSGWAGRTLNSLPNISTTTVMVNGKSTTAYRLASR